MLCAVATVLRTSSEYSEKLWEKHHVRHCNVMLVKEWYVANIHAE